MSQSPSNRSSASSDAPPSPSRSPNDLPSSSSSPGDGASSRHARRSPDDLPSSDNPRPAGGLNTHPAPAAVLTAVSKTYHLEAVEVHALRAVDLEIRSRCFTAIAGPSGSGKTTLLNLLGCIDRPDQGQLIVAGTPVTELSDNALTDFRASHLGFVFQSFNLIPVLTAYENVEYPLRLTNTPAPRRRERVHEVLESVGLTAHARHRPGQLSGGQQQRVAIARALAAAPRIILADEPTANLDSHTGASIIELLRRMQREHDVSIVICSHDPQVIASADETVFIRDGRVDSVSTRTDSAGTRTDPTNIPADSASRHPDSPPHRTAPASSLASSPNRHSAS